MTLRRGGWLLGLLLVLLAPLAARADLQPGEGAVLCTENFLPPNVEDYNGLQGWRLIDPGTQASPVRRVMISVEGGRARLSNASRESSTAMWRMVPLFPNRVTPGTLYQQMKITRVGGTGIIWLFANAGGTYVTGDVPGIWTAPFRRVAPDDKLPANESYRLDLIGKDYIEVEYLRLVCGLPPMGAVWQRAGDPAWTTPLAVGQEILLQANLGLRTTPPTARFFHVSYNRFLALDLVKNNLQPLPLRDDGQAGDDKANDGIWTLTVTRQDLAPQNARELVAGITFGEDKADITYAICPWALSK